MARTPVVLLSILLAAAGCSHKPRIVVGSKNFTEQVVLGEIIAAQIERRLPGVEVDRKLDLGGTLLAHEALKSGSIDIYPEYTGTALTAVLHQPPIRDSEAGFQKLQDEYRKWQLEWMPPLGFNDSFAMVVMSDLAREQNLKTISDAVKRPWKLGVGYEFVERPDGLKGMQEAYGLRLEGDPITMDLGLLYQALRSKKVEMAAANATDGMLAHQEFTILEDDRHYFPPYECSLVVRSQILQQFPQLKGALEELSGKISNDTMRKLNAMADIDHKSASGVAREFIQTWK
ncbi:MAG TPA: glycine betaine ABC transporter substrate-binding protein [Bryobacteraceae bacterium]|jgi:glycine betaine/choline ABC-type transport system substrate-binding protein